MRDLEHRLLNLRLSYFQVLRRAATEKSGSQFKPSVVDNVFRCTSEVLHLQMLLEMGR